MEHVPVQDNSVVKTGEWVITLIITAIPLVGLIMLFVWGFSSSTNPSKANWAKATLILYAILIVLSLIVAMLFGAALFNLDNYNY